MASDDKLKILGQTAYDVPENTEAFINEMASAHSTLKEAFPDEGYLSDDFGEMFDSVETDIQGFIKEAGEEYGNLQEQLLKTIGIVEEVSETMSEGSQSLALELNKLISEVDNLGATLKNEAERIASSLEGLERVRGELDQTNTTRMPMLIAEFKSLAEKYKSAGESMETVDTQIEQKVDTFESEFYDQKTLLEADIEIWPTLVDGKIDFLIESLAEDYEEARAAYRKSLEEGEKQLQTDLIKTLDAALEQLRLGIEKTEQSIDEATGETTAVRERAQPALERIQASAKKVEDQVTRIDGVVNQFSAIA